MPRPTHGKINKHALAWFKYANELEQKIESLEASQENTKELITDQERLLDLSTNMLREKEEQSHGQAVLIQKTRTFIAYDSNQTIMQRVVMCDLLEESITAYNESCGKVEAATV